MNPECPTNKKCLPSSGDHQPPRPFNGGAAARVQPYIRVDAQARGNLAVPANDNGPVSVAEGGILAAAQRTVVIVDLVGYGVRALDTEAMLGAGSAALVDHAIQTMIDKALKRSGASQRRVYQRTGDGAILVFRAPDRALAFLATLREVSQTHNAGSVAARSDFVSLVFRAGVATGIVTRTQYGLSGTVFLTAARLESACPPGGAMVCSATWAGANPVARTAYGPAEIVMGKNEERFIAHRVPAYPGAARDAARRARRPRGSRLGRRVRALLALAGRGGRRP